MLEKRAELISDPVVGWQGGWGEAQIGDDGKGSFPQLRLFQGVQRIITRK